MRDKIAQRIRYELAVEVTDSNRFISPEATALRSQMLHLISKKKPSYLSVVSSQQASGPSDYQAMLVISRFEVNSAIVRAENRTHRYTVYRDVPNEEIPKVQILLDFESRELRQLRRLANQPCRHCQGHGKVRCPSCSGKGRRVCKSCKGTARSAAPACPSCAGTGKASCQKCKGSGRITCPKCKGSGKNPYISPRTIRRQARTVRDLANRLDRLPATVRRAFPAEWPYVVNYHQKQGRIEARIQLLNPAAGLALPAEAIRKTALHKDSTILNPSPEIGLPADTLNLPSDETVRKYLINQAAAQAASKVLNPVVQNRITEVRTTIDQLKLQGQPHQALEAQVDLAGLLAPSDPAAAAKIITTLRQELQLAAEPGPAKADLR